MCFWVGAGTDGRTESTPEGTRASETHHAYRIPMWGGAGGKGEEGRLMVKNNLEIVGIHSKNNRQLIKHKDNPNFISFILLFRCFSYVF